MSAPILSTSSLSNVKNINSSNVIMWDRDDDSVEPGETSEISKIFQDATVFITGGTGFLGSLYIEKFIRIAPTLRVYMLLRPKKNKSVEERFQNFLQSQIFDNLKRKRPNFSKNIIPISGDITEPNLGMLPADIELIIKESNYVVHCAATVRFVEHIRSSTYSNVRSTIDLIAMAKQMTQLKAFLHVSTAFANCLQPTIEEKFYEPPLSVEKLMYIIENFNDEDLDKITPILLKDFPNTYLFTKVIAEHVVKTHGHGLPISVVRPSMVVSTSKEPITGWIDNFYVPTGVVVGVGFGIIRALPIAPTTLTEIIPADFVVNCGIAALWKVHKEPNQMQVYNCVTTARKPMDFNTFFSTCKNYGEQIPLMKAIWPMGVIFTNSKIWYSVLEFIFQILPAYLADFYLVCHGKRPFVIKKLNIVRSLHGIMKAILTSDITFSDSNIQNLCQELNNVDKKEFDFNVETLDWDDYLLTYCKGLRVYLVNDPMTTVEPALKRYKKLKIYQFILNVVFWLVLLAFLRVLFHFIF